MILNEDYFDKADINYDETARDSDDMDSPRTDINLQLILALPVCCAKFDNINRINWKRHIRIISQVMNNLRIFNRSAELKFIHFCVQKNMSFGYEYEKPWVYDVSYTPEQFDNKKFVKDVFNEMNEFCYNEYAGNDWEWYIEDSKKERTTSELFFYQPISLMLHIVLDYDIDSVNKELPMDAFKQEFISLQNVCIDWGHIAKILKKDSQENDCPIMLKYKDNPNDEKAFVQGNSMTMFHWTQISLERMYHRFLNDGIEPDRKRDSRANALNVRGHISPIVYYAYALEQKSAQIPGYEFILYGYAADTTDVLRLYLVMKPKQTGTKYDNISEMNKWVQQYLIDNCPEHYKLRTISETTEQKVEVRICTGKDFIPTIDTKKKEYGFTFTEEFGPRTRMLWKVHYVDQNWEIHGRYKYASRKSTFINGSASAAGDGHYNYQDALKAGFFGRYAQEHVKEIISPDRFYK